MNLVNQFRNEVLKLRSKASVDQTVLKKFLDRIETNHNLVRENNPTDHFCSFFVPFSKSTKSIFIGHHIKAGDWIPPGGHIDKEEEPTDTVQREFQEELHYTIDNKDIHLFDLTKIPVRKTKRTCKIHYDFWYYVPIKKINFEYDTSEFYKAGWFSIKDASHMIQREVYNLAVQKLLSIV